MWSDYSYSLTVLFVDMCTDPLFHDAALKIHEFFKTTNVLYVAKIKTEVTKHKM